MIPATMANPRCSSLHLAAALAAATALAACDGAPARSSTDGGVVRVGGSSSVFPLSEAVVKEFGKHHPRVQVRLSISGTGGGFQNFCRGRIDIAAAARPVRRPEAEACERSAVSFIELPIAYDGIAVVVNRKASWVDVISVAELRKLWTPEAQGNVTRWNQIRPDWPDRQIHLFGPDPSSGTYDYFTAAIIGEEGSSRHDFTDSADDNVLVQAVADDELALAYLPLAYYEKNKHRVKTVAIDVDQLSGGSAPIAVNPNTILAGTYPLARPVFIYVRDQALNRNPVTQFVDFYLGHVNTLAERLGYLQLGEDAYKLVAERRNARWTGTVFGGEGSQVGMTLQQLLERTRIR
jgi:phosphate transport system substrate-binding protein